MFLSVFGALKNVSVVWEQPSDKCACPSRKRPTFLSRLKRSVFPPPPTDSAIIAL